MKILLETVKKKKTKKNQHSIPIILPTASGS